MEAYCMKCKAKREMVQVTESTSANGAVHAMGRCNVCRTKMSAFLKGGRGT